MRNQTEAQRERDSACIVANRLGNGWVLADPNPNLLLVRRGSVFFRIRDFLGSRPGTCLQGNQVTQN